MCKESEQCLIFFFTIVISYNGPLQLVDCSIHNVRYDTVLELECCWRPTQIGLHQVTYDAVAWLIHVQNA
eukprot:scaffold21743_cov144-Skeletonema_dohrnii-CCMP3373.AAC.1